MEDPNPIVEAEIVDSRRRDGARPRSVYILLVSQGEIVRIGAAIGPEASVNKVFWSEMDVRLHEAAMRLLGPYAELAEGAGESIDGEAGSTSVARRSTGTLTLATSCGTSP